MKVTFMSAKMSGARIKRTLVRIHELNDIVARRPLTFAECSEWCNGYADLEVFDRQWHCGKPVFRFKPDWQSRIADLEHRYLKRDRNEVLAELQADLDYLERLGNA